VKDNPSADQTFLFANGKQVYWSLETVYKKTGPFQFTSIASKDPCGFGGRKSVIDLAPPRKLFVPGMAWELYLASYCLKPEPGIAFPPRVEFFAYEALQIPYCVKYEASRLEYDPMEFGKAGEDKVQPWATTTKLFLVVEIPVGAVAKDVNVPKKLSTTL